jgi:heptosyltransferase-2
VATDAHWLHTFREEHALHTRKFLVIHPGSGSPRKNWQGYDPFIARWRSRHSEAIVVLNGPAEAATPLSREANVLAATGLSLPQVAALVQDSRLYLGNDSGVSHLAGAVGGRGVVLFGPSDPAVWAPRGETLRGRYILRASPSGRARRC